MKAQELKEYIETLSAAHAAGHKCDKELKTAVELYTVEVGLRDTESYIKEKVKEQATLEAKAMIRKFVSKYYDFMKGTAPLVKSSDLYGAFMDYVSKMDNN